MKTARCVAIGGVLLGLALAGCSSTDDSSATAPVETSQQTLLPSAIAELPADIAASGELVIATDGVTPPNSYPGDDGSLVGWEIELATELAARLGLTPRFVVTPFAEIIPDVVDGSADVGLASIFDTAERRASVDFVDYFEAGTTWAAPTGSEITPDTACGLTIAVKAGSTQETTDLPARSAACVAAGDEPLVIRPLPGQGEVTDEVLLGYAAAFLADSPVTQDAVLRSSGRLVEVGRTYDLQLVGMPVATYRAGLADALRSAVLSMQDDGRYDRVLGKWGVEQGSLSARAVAGQSP